MDDGIQALPVENYIDRLPDDVLQILFLTACGPFFSAFRAFGEARRVIYMVCSRWFHLALQSRLLWSSLRVTKSQSLANLRYLLRRSGPGPLRLGLHFNEAPKRRPGPKHNPPLPAIMAMLAPHFPRLISLVLYVGDTDVIPMLKSAVNGIALPNLRSLSIRQYSFFAANSTTLYIPPATFGSVPASLHSLVLSIIPFDCATLPVLPNMCQLVFRDMQRSNFPVWSDFILLCRATPNVREVSLNRVGFQLVPSTLAPLDVWPQLVKLHVALGGNPSVARFLAHGDFVSIDVLYISVISDVDVTLLLQASSLLAKVSRLFMDGMRVAQITLQAVFDTTDGLEIFHTPTIGRAALLALQSSPSTARKLKAVGVAMHDPSEILAFAEGWVALSDVRRRGMTLWTPRRTSPLSPSFLRDPAMEILKNTLHIKFRTVYPIAASHFDDVALPA
ncbi:hypothetical protein C8F04DRAFT_1259933 [Mycena alexandri]|uniref:F-box domain-containing protein n=1 Tax=Mycena alexandri TaxID=1745969 RepID=A0AAD6SY50_9AGAR|nr:hypothetical protein C8F04DRAFT_1259933 [Mycena alexandri]